jgi:hypothetical protein
MALLDPNLDYTNLDFESIRERLINLILGAFDDWTDFETANFGNILLELMAFVGDILTNLMDNQARESRLETVQLRQNALALARFLGYDASTASPATTAALFTLASIPAFDVTLPAGTIVRTRDPSQSVRFQLLVPLTILAGTDPPQAFGDVENSRTTIAEPFVSSDLPNQQFLLSNTPYIDNTAIVTAGDGAYTQVNNFLSSTATDRHYTVTVDASDRARIRFGNGVSGAIPVGNIFVTYKTGGGRAGNVDANTINTIEGSFTDAQSNVVTVTVTNPEQASGGENRETVQQIKQNAPASLRVSDRTVALEDYVLGAEQVGGVARALMVTSDQLPDAVIEENRGRLYVVPVGGGLPTDTLKAAVLEAVTVTRPNTITFQLTVEDPLYLTVNVAMTIFLDADADATSTASTVRANLAEFFQILNPDQTINTNIDFGLNYLTGRAANEAPEIPLSDITNVVRDTEGVRKLGTRDSDSLLNGVHADLPINAVEFPVLGTVTLTDGDTGALL